MLRVGAAVLRTDEEEGWVLDRVTGVAGSGEKTQVSFAHATRSVDQVHVAAGASSSRGAPPLQDLSDAHEEDVLQHLRDAYLGCVLEVGKPEDMHIFPSIVRLATYQTGDGSH
ncbi:hypothetical protein DIPPA_35154 [Diplonema papillatum]|nr:hypothetical protein DIPPA_35154 [Diplonema papillatum]